MLERPKCKGNGILLSVDAVAAELSLNERIDSNLSNRQEKVQSNHEGKLGAPQRIPKQPKCYPRDYIAAANPENVLVPVILVARTSYRRIEVCSCTL